MKISILAAQVLVFLTGLNAGASFCGSHACNLVRECKQYYSSNDQQTAMLVFKKSNSHVVIPENSMTLIMNGLTVDAATGFMDQSSAIDVMQFPHESEFFSYNLYHTWDNTNESIKDPRTLEIISLGNSLALKEGALIPELIFVTQKQSGHLTAFICDRVYGGTVK